MSILTHTFALSHACVCIHIPAAGPADLRNSDLQRTVCVLCVHSSNECVATQSPAGPWPFQPRDVSPQQQSRGFSLWDHIPAAGPSDQPATGSQRIHLGMPRRAQTVRCRSQSLTASSRAMSVHRASHRAAAAGDRISNRRRTVSSSLISLNRYTTLKIAGAAHKLSTSRFSEPTFWKLPGTGHKNDIKVCHTFESLRPILRVKRVRLPTFSWHRSHLSAPLKKS